MEKKEIQVIVSGQLGSGKSHILYLIKNHLREQGFEVEFEGTVDFPTEQRFNRYITKHFYKETTEALKKTKRIVLKEIQLQRVPMNRTAPPLPKPPMSRLIFQGTIGTCPICHSTERRRFWVPGFYNFGKKLGCVQSECPNYYLKNKE